MTGFLYDNCVARIADPLFFAITAFFMFRGAFEQDLSWRSLGKYMLRIGLLYGCWVLIYAPVILQRAVYVAGGGWTLIRYLLQQIFLSGPYGALWFLTALLLAIPLTFVVTKYLGPAAGILLLVAALLSVLCVGTGLHESGGRSAFFLQGGGDGHGCFHFSVERADLRFLFLRAGHVDRMETETEGERSGRKRVGRISGRRNCAREECAGRRMGRYSHGKGLVGMSRIACGGKPAAVSLSSRNGLRRAVFPDSPDLFSAALAAFPAVCRAEAIPGICERPAY